MQFCRYCGASLPDEAQFCTSCGKSTMAQAAGPPPSPAPSDATAPMSLSLLSAKDMVLNKKILSVREHYDISDPGGNPIGKAEGNFFQFPAKFSVWDQNGAEVMYIEGKLLSLRREFDIYDASGSALAAIKKKIVKLIGSEYWLELNGVQFARIYGNFVEHDYRIEYNGSEVAQVHKQWVAVRDTFGISITGTVDPRLVLGSVIVIEHEEVTERRSDRY